MNYFLSPVLATKYLSLVPFISSIKPFKRLITKYKDIILLLLCSGIYAI